MFWRSRKYQPRHLDPGHKTEPPVAQTLGPATAYPQRAGAYAVPHNQGEWPPPPATPIVGPGLPMHRCRNERT
jgi:hypothetical protein